MELNEYQQSDKLERAQNRVKELKGFYIHWIVYLIINILISTTTIMARMDGGETFNEAFFNFASFSTAIFWGIGLAFHAAKVFNYNPFFTKDWEERQIEKYVEQDKKEAEKFR